MRYPFLTLDDQTEIVHSEMKAGGSVKVYMERPDEKDCFHYATYYLPMYRWEYVFGFSVEDMNRLKDVVESTAQLILCTSQSQTIEKTTHG